MKYWIIALIVLGLSAPGFSQKPKKVRKGPPPTYPDVAYDVYEKTKIDFWQAEGDGPRPVLIYIHGGGWTSGDKNSNADPTPWLQKGISYASVNYRLSTEAPLPVPVHDAARAIQFIKSKSADWNLRKDRLVLTGGSAGACTSMWILCHDDLAQPDSDDPVARESTRVQGAVVSGGQTSIDPKQIEPWLGANVLQHRMINLAVGEKTMEGALANYQKHESLYKEFSAYNHVTKDDPPLYMSYGGDMTLPSKNAGHGIHHPVYGVKMKEKCDKVGQTCYLHIPGHSSPPLSGNEFIESILLGKSKYTIPETDEGLPGAGPIRRYDWFRKLWEKKRSGWAGEVSKDQGAVVFLGDSITQGWGATMHGAFGNMKVANRGISGDTTRGMLIRLQEDVLSLNPSGVAMLLGTNDLEEGAEPEVIAANFSLIVAALKKHNPDMPIVVSLVFPSSDTKKRPADKIKKINELYAAVVKDDPQITVVDTWTLFADEAGDAKKVEFPDLLHPNKTGYEKWAKALAPVFATLGLLDTEPDTFLVEEGYVSLFNGKDLSGWGFRPTKPRKKPNPIFAVVTEAVDFDGKTESPDHRYRAKNGRLIVATPPSGRRIQQIWTTKEFSKDFTLKLDFRATPNADSGIFIRGKQLQCRDFSLAGPYTDLKAYKPQEWNEVVIKVTGTTAHCTSLFHWKCVNPGIKLR
ncbi:MAG: GDSL-type esterase/lipase family protein, partial [Verrucomicrobiales bacterium]|nr:GDSL-type esterase/lipase family protein [Verrucomicrobiales bacterium]